MSEEEKLEQTTQEDQEQVQAENTSGELAESQDSEELQEAQESVKEAMPVEYKCFSCNKIISDTYIRKKVRCPYCGSKIIFKGRVRENIVKAR